MDVDNIENYSNSKKECALAVKIFLTTDNLKSAVAASLEYVEEYHYISTMVGALAGAYYKEEDMTEFLNDFSYWYIDNSLLEMIKTFKETF